MSDTFIVRLPHKRYHFVRTGSRFFEISEARVLTNGDIHSFDGVLPNAAQTPDSTVADLVAQGERYKHKIKGKASNMREFKKEVV